MTTRTTAPRACRARKGPRAIVVLGAAATLALWGPVVSASPIGTLAAGSSGSPGSAWAWGFNGAGQLGNGTTTNSSTPVVVSLPSGTTVTAIAGGGDHSLAVTSSGQVLAWGNNFSGQLGNGTTTDSSTPVQVSLPSGTTVTAIAGGLYHSLALTSSGQVLAWGDNGYGQLGNGTTIGSLTPVVVSLPSGTTVTAIAGGAVHSLALTSSGQVLAWGFNGYGQLGNGTTIGSTTPVQVSLPSGITVTAIAAGDQFSLALTSTGQVLAWGNNQFGQLGNGTTTTTGCFCISTPVSVSLPSGTTVTAIASGGDHSLALTSSGQVLAWGYNVAGELGNGTTTNSSTPVVVSLPSGTTVTAIAGGSGHSLAVTSSGQVLAWGNNFSGQLGNGTTTTTGCLCISTPVVVSAFPAAVAIASGRSYSLAIQLGSQGSASAPTQVTAKATGNKGEVHITWQPPSTGPPITGYGVNVYNSQTTSTYAYAAGVTSATIGQLNNCTSYRFDVYAVAASGSSGPAPSVYATPYTVALSSNGAPKYVVILVGGTNTENPAPTPDYQPLGVGAAAFCFGSDYINGQPPPGEASVPPQLKAIGDTWADDKSIAKSPHQLLTSQLAAEGAVILPFSYNEANLVGSSTDPGVASFHFTPFTKLDVTLTYPPAEANALENEVVSVNNIWPNARILIVGHSLGGLIAQLWYSSYGTYNSTTSQNGVDAVFSLDAPIGGVQDSLLCTGIVAPALVPFCTFMAGVGPVVADWYYASWVVQDAIWQSILNLDGNGQYIPVGTSGDNLYSFGDFPIDGQFSQLLFTPGCTVPCNPAGYDFGSACSGVPSDLLDSHSFVKNCPNVVNYIGCVLIGQGAGCSIPAAPSISRNQIVRPKLAAAVPTITGTLSPSVVLPSQSATISGTGLGTTPGLVQFMGKTSGLVNASVSSWTDTQISLTVPLDAMTGPVNVQSNAGTSIVVGEATVLAVANGVATVAATLVGSAPLDGQPAAITVLATDAGGNPVSNATVGLSNGVGVVTGQTDSTGHVTLQMPGFGTMGLVAYSGSASTTINIPWTAPPPMTLALASSSRTPATGAPITIWATLDDASGQPAGSQPVAFRVLGPASITLSSSVVSTDSSGTATITVTNTGDGPFVLVATADSYAANASIAIRPILPVTGAPAAPARIQAIPGDGEVTLAWPAPGFIGGGPITGYTVTASPGGATTTVSATVPAATITGLTNGAAYTFTVAATNTIGTGSASPPSSAVTPAAVAQGAAVAVLPAMSNGGYGGYLTAAYLENVSGSAAHVRVQYFDTSGHSIGFGNSAAGLVPGGTWTLRTDNGHALAATQAGSAVVYSDQPLAVFVNEFAPGNTSDATSYSSISAPSGTGGTLYAPAIANNAYGGYTTGIGLVNLATTSANITITYRDGTGAQIKAQTVPNVAAGAYQGLYSGDATLNLPNGFAGTATITSSAGNLAAVVNETGPGGQFSSYDAVPAGSTTLFAPAALSNAYGGYNTGMGIQNTTGSAGTVTINYYDANGVATTKSFPIVANGYLGIYQGTDITFAGAYTAKITSTVAIAGIVNEVAAVTNPLVQQSTAYDMFAAGSSSLHLPLVESGGSDGWSTGEGIMNTGTAATTVTVTYYEAASGLQVGTPDSLLLQPNAFWGLYQPAGGLPSGTRATAVITTSSGGQVAVICNESSATTFMSYDGQ